MSGAAMQEVILGMLGRTDSFENEPVNYVDAIIRR